MTDATNASRVLLGNGALTVNGVIAMTGGTIDTGETGTLTFGSGSSLVATSIGAAAATIQGNGAVALGGSTRTFDVADGAAAFDGNAFLLGLARGLRARLAYAALWSAMGVGLEFVQGGLGYRSFETADMLANALGVLVGWASAFAISPGPAGKLR